MNIYTGMIQMGQLNFLSVKDSKLECLMKQSDLCATSSQKLIGPVVVVGRVCIRVTFLLVNDYFCQKCYGRHSILVLFIMDEGHHCCAYLEQISCV